MNIFTAIPKIMDEIGAIGKDKKNQQQGFMYRGVDDVMNALQPMLTKHKVFIVPEVIEQSREEKTTKSGSTLIYSICRIQYTFYADDGSNVVAVVVGEGMDSGDKATNKAMAIAFKYACFQVFCIPTEEMPDPDKETHEVASKPKQAAEVKKPPAPDKPEGVISEAQQKRLFAIGKGKTTEQIKAIVTKYGYASSKDIKVVDYDKICKEVEA